jgi:hypothetical protein
VLEVRPPVPELGSGVECLVRIRRKGVLEAQLLVPKLGPELGSELLSLGFRV